MSPGDLIEVRKREKGGRRECRRVADEEENCEEVRGAGYRGLGDPGCNCRGRRVWATLRAGRRGCLIIPR